MTTNQIRVRARAREVFAVLADGWMYSNWVVGTSHVRAVEESWPAVGSRLYHAAGAWPLATRDQTVVESVDIGRALTLRAHGRRFGTARIMLEVDDVVGDACLVSMHETPIDGPGKWVDSFVTQALLHRRNTESLARLAAVSERRNTPSN